MNGKSILPKSNAVLVSSLKVGEEGTFTGVTDHTPAFLNYLDKTGISLGSCLKVKSIEEFDQTFTLQLKPKREVVVSHKVANSLLVG